MSKVQNNEDSTLICHSLKCATEISDSDSILQKTIENFWEMKSFDSKADNSTVYKSFNEDICYSSNEARYEVRLPFKDDHEILPDNVTHWEHRLSNSAKKLSKNSDLLHAYNEIIINQLNTNIIEPNLETDSISPGHVHYLLHRPIIKDSKTKKICMVYDASSNASGPSLNDCLYPGPALCESLFGVLL